MKQLQFIRDGLAVNLLVAERVEDILPRLTAAMRKVSEPEKEMQTAEVEQL
jgi:hypothetical protein